MRMDELIKRLQRQYHPETELVAVFWQKDDVLTRAKDRGLVISDEEAGDIVEALEDRHDACIGINWDVIDFHLDDLKHNEPL